VTQGIARSGRLSLGDVNFVASVEVGIAEQIVRIAFAAAMGALALALAFGRGSRPVAQGMFEDVYRKSRDKATNEGLGASMTPSCAAGTSPTAPAEDRSRLCRNPTILLYAPCTTWGWLPGSEAR
jgi:hypothetical protein